MQLCEGVLVVLDPGAVVFTRIWCGFEQATVVQGKKLLLDFATVYDGTPQLLTEGLAHEKEAEEMKATRERRFPLERMEKGYSLDITAADASRPKDKRHILNSIAKRDDLEAEPDLTDPEFARVNAVLRSTLAEHAALRAADEGRLKDAVAVATAGKDAEAELACVHEIALQLYKMGKFKDAEELHRDVLARREAALGEEHPATLASVNELGLVLKAMGRLEEAEPLLRRALAGYEAALGEEHPHTLTSVASLGQLLQAMGKLADAEPLYRRALEGCKKVFGENQPKSSAP